MNELTISNPFEIKTFAEAEKLSAMIANSSLCPPQFKGKPGDVFVAIQMGNEVGLSPMQAIQNIAVINARPCLYGDAVIGLVRAHKHCEYVKEWSEGTIKDGNMVAFCEIQRKGSTPEVRHFSIDDAKKAGLWEKAGPWKQYPARMLQMRARGFACRDVFADALRGLHVAEEAQDLPQEADFTVVQQASQDVNKALGYDAPVLQNENNFLQVLGQMKNAESLENLKKIYTAAYKNTHDEVQRSLLIEAKDLRISELKEMNQPKIEEVEKAEKVETQSIDEWVKDFDSEEKV